MCPWPVTVADDKPKERLRNLCRLCLVPMGTTCLCSGPDPGPGVTTMRRTLKPELHSPHSTQAKINGLCIAPKHSPAFYLQNVHAGPICPRTAVLRPLSRPCVASRGLELHCPCVQPKDHRANGLLFSHFIPVDLLNWMFPITSY